MCGLDPESQFRGVLATERIAETLDDLVAVLRSDSVPENVDIADTLGPRRERMREELGKWSMIPTDSRDRRVMIDRLINAVLG